MRLTRFRDNARMRDERGQATTEFALIFIPLMMVVAGIIYFGIGLNYWLDMNRVANQGARSAAVDNWPAQCARTRDVVQQQQLGDRVRHRARGGIAGDAAGRAPLLGAEQPDA